MNKIIKKFFIPPKMQNIHSWKMSNIDYAYKMGYDCAINGANITNCHFTIFSSPENTKAWEEGKKEGEREGGDNGNKV